MSGAELSSIWKGEEGISGNLARQLLREEIDRIVAEARESGDTVRTGYHAGMLFASYPASGFSIGRIVDELALAASAAGVAVEIARRR